MSWVLRDDITDSQKENIGLFTKQFEAKVRIYTGLSPGTYDTSSGSRSPYGYASGTGIYRFHFPLFIRKLALINAGTKEVVKVEYKDFDGNWIFHESIEVTPSASLFPEFENSVFASDFRFSLVTKVDPDTPEYASICFVYAESWLDVTRMCTRDLKIAREIDPLGTNIKLPHFSIGLENSDGQWNKYQTQSLTAWHHTWSGTDAQYNLSSSTGKDFATYRKVGARCMALVKFYGKGWKDSDWIIQGIFNIRKFTNTNMSGESAWVAKTPLHSPMAEDAYPDEVIENTIARHRNTSPLQIAKAGEREVLSSENEFVGELNLFTGSAYSSASGQEVMLGNTASFGHCQDDKFIYYLEPTISKSGTWEDEKFPNSHTMLVKRMTHTGDGIETIGKIKSKPPYKDDAGWIIGGGTQQWGQVSDILDNALFTRYTRNVHFCCDDEYFYVSLVGITHAKFFDPSPPDDHDRLMYERCMFRLRKDGVGWESLFFGMTIHNAKQADTWGFETSYTKTDSYGNRKWSSGDVDLTASSMIGDPEDWSVNPKIVGPVMLFDDNGTEKILAAHRVEGPYTGTGKINELWVWGKDLLSLTKMGDVADGLHIWSFCQYSDLTWFVCYNDGNDSDKRKVGIMDRDSNGDFYIKTTGEAEIDPAYKSLSILGDSLWGGGSNYHHGDEICYSPGLRQLYQCMFKLDGASIIHELHETNNDYLSHRFPVIKYQGTDLSRDEVEYGQEYLVGDEYVNLMYVINLRTGYISLRQVLPSAGVTDRTLYISYDFVNSFQFFHMKEEDSRIGNNALGKISQSLLGIYGINEYGMIEKIPFSQYQFMSLRHSVIEYHKETDDDGEDAMYIVPTTGPSDYLTAFQFTPDYDGYIDAIRIPIRLTQIGADQGSNSPVGFKIWAGGPTKTGGGDFTKFGGTACDTLDETILKSTWTLLVTEDFFIDKGKVPVGTPPQSSPYVWRGFDLSSAAFEVTAGKTYAICLQSVGNAGNLYQYELMTKGVDYGNNQMACDTTPTGTDISTRVSESWYMGCYVKAGDNWGEVVNTVIEIEKKKQAISGTNIVDSLNPDIDAGFVSKIGGSNSTIKVSDANYQNVYIKGTDYSITYSSSQYWINFITLGIDDVIVIHWFESRIIPPLLSDSRQSNLAESSEWGDNTAIRSCTVTGVKRLPANINVRINKIYTIPPGADRDLLVTNEVSREAQSEDVIRDWDDVKKEYVRILDQDDTIGDRYNQYKKFAFEFKDPFISGTTGYRVRYGLGSTSDTVNAGQITSTFINAHDVPLFYKIWFATGEDFGDDIYKIMFKKAQYQEWRVATEDDISDIPGNYKLGLDPSTRESGKVPGDDLTFTGSIVREGSFFIVKHMNEYYGESTLDFLAYLTEEKKFYIDKNGQVVEDASYDAEDLTKNPFPSSYPGKPVIVIVSPQDFSRNPLFEYHSEVAKDGYSSGAHADIDAWASSRIDRVEVMPSGVNAVYSNWSTDSQFIDIEIYGYPLNNVSSVRYRKTLPGAEHVDAKKLEIKNDLIGSEIVAKLKCDQVIDFWGEERNILKRSAVYSPKYYPGMILRLSSEYQDQTEQLYYTLGLSHDISSDNMRTNFTKLLEI